VVFRTTISDEASAASVDASKAKVECSFMLQDCQPSRTLDTDNNIATKAGQIVQYLAATTFNIPFCTLSVNCILS
jgi:hypothetical protein